MWTTGFARPPFVATCSVWESATAAREYAYGTAEPAHAEAVAAGVREPFHHQEAFIRFRPLGASGHLQDPREYVWDGAVDAAFAARRFALAEICHQR